LLTFQVTAINAQNTNHNGSFRVQMSAAIEVSKILKQRRTRKGAYQSLWSTITITRDTA